MSARLQRLSLSCHRNHVHIVCADKALSARTIADIDVVAQKRLLSPGAPHLQASQGEKRDVNSVQSFNTLH